MSGHEIVKQSAGHKSFEVVCACGWRKRHYDRRPQAAKHDARADNCVEELGRAGIAVVLIHHAGKPGEDGRPRTSPLGTTGIEAWARHLVRVDADKDGYREIVAWGNDLDRGSVTVPFAITDAGVVPAPAKVKGKQNRAKAILDANEVTARLVVEHCQGMNAAQVSRWLAEHDRREKRKTAGTYTKELSNGVLSKNAVLSGR